MPLLLCTLLVLVLLPLLFIDRQSMAPTKRPAGRLTAACKWDAKSSVPTKKPSLNTTVESDGAGEDSDSNDNVALESELVSCEVLYFEADSAGSVARFSVLADTVQPGTVLLTRHFSDDGLLSPRQPMPYTTACSISKDWWSKLRLLVPRRRLRRMCRI